MASLAQHRFCRVIALLCYWSNFLKSDTGLKSKVIDPVCGYGSSIKCIYICLICVCAEYKKRQNLWIRRVKSCYIGILSPCMVFLRRRTSSHMTHHWHWLAAENIISFMMTSSNGNIIRVTGLLCGEFTGHRWMPLTKASDEELWCFLLFAPEQTVE